MTTSWRWPERISHEWWSSFLGEQKVVVNTVQEFFLSGHKTTSLFFIKVFFWRTFDFVEDAALNAPLTLTLPRKGDGFWQTFGWFFTLIIIQSFFSKIINTVKYIFLHRSNCWLFFHTVVNNKLWSGHFLIIAVLD